MVRMVAKESIEQKESLGASPEQGSNTEVLDGALETGSEKVSEVVGESASENLPVKSTKTPATKDASGKSIAPVVSDTNVVLPSVTIQRKKVTKVLMKQRGKILKEIRKIEKSPDFSANNLEKAVQKLRKVQHLLSELVTAAKGRMEQLYKQYVVGTK